MVNVFNAQTPGDRLPEIFFSFLRYRKVDHPAISGSGRCSTRPSAIIRLASLVM